MDREVVLTVRRTFIAGVLALTFTLTAAGLVSATATASISPPSQTNNHGASADWTLAWGGASPFRTVCFYYDKNNNGEGWWCLLNTPAVGATDHHTFWPCSTTTYTQLLNVTDWASSFKSATSTAKEYGGTPC
jgi:hypothetical protein